MPSSPDRQPAPLKPNRATTVAGFILFIMACAFVFTLIRGAVGEDRVPWREDLIDAQAEARSQDKLVLINFTADWCSPCRKMKQFVYSRDDVVELIGADFVPVKMDMTAPAPEDPQSYAAAEMQIKGLPTLVAADPDGREIGRVSGPLDPADMKNWLSAMTAGQSPR